MRKKLFTLLLSLAAMTMVAYAQEDIVILHTNDIHCGYLSYDKVAALAQEADLLVDAGDAIQGDVIGTLSKGGYITDIMNYLGYDLAIPGNHEFDYGMEQFLYLAEEKANFPYVAANFTSLSTGESCLKAMRPLRSMAKPLPLWGSSLRKALPSPPPLISKTRMDSLSTASAKETTARTSMTLYRPPLTVQRPPERTMSSVLHILAWTPAPPPGPLTR